MKRQGKTGWWLVGAVASVIVAANISFLLKNASRQGRLTSVMSTGRIIYVSLFARSTADTSNTLVAWPQTDGARHLSGIAHQNSTEFFKWCVTSGSMNVHVSLFGGHFLSPDKSVDLESFSAKDNVWSIVADIDDHMPDGTPVLITSNVAVTNTGQLTGRILDSLTNVPPLNLDGVVVMQNGGAGISVSGEQLEKTWEEVLGPQSPGSYAVLRP